MPVGFWHDGEAAVQAVPRPITRLGQLCLLQQSFKAIEVAGSNVRLPMPSVNRLAGGDWPQPLQSDH